MKALVQRVTNASVMTGGTVVGECGAGLLIFLGVVSGDTPENAVRLADKISRLRIFADAAGKMNLSVNDIGGGALVVSQFTLAADCSHGNRPDFTGAAPAELARTLYSLFSDRLREAMVSHHVQNGVFGADMKVSLTNDGPATFIIEV